MSYFSKVASTNNYFFCLALSVPLERVQVVRLEVVEGRKKTASRGGLKRQRGTGHQRTRPSLFLVVLVRVLYPVLAELL